MGSGDTDGVGIHVKRRYKTDMEKGHICSGDPHGE